ncbi:hypothetical protein ACW7G0_13920 [Lysobacter sp. A286]
MELNHQIRRSPAYQRLTPQGVEYVEHALTADPSRFVGRNSIFSVSGAYASDRFPHLTEYESGSCEKLFVLEAVLERRVLDLRAQPPPIIQVITDKRGRKRAVEATPDYLVFGLNSIALVECKRKKQLEELVGRSPDWMQIDSGEYIHSPALEAASKFGIDFKVYCPDHLPMAYRANLQLLARLPREDLLANYPGTLRLIRKRLAARPHTVLELCSAYEGVTGAWLYQAIWQEELFGLLKHQHLGIDFVIYGTKAEADKRTLHLDCAVPVLEPGPLHLRLLRASSKELELAAAAQQRFDQRRERKALMNATDYRDAHNLRIAKAEQAPRMAAFLRKLGDRGGKGNPVPPRVRDETRNHAISYLSKGVHPAKTKIYADFQIHMEALGLPVPSRETHRQILNREVGAEKAAFLAGGKRAMHAVRARTDGANANPSLKVGGLRVHIDGVYGDIKSKKNHESEFERPIFYPLVDDASGYILGRGVKVGRSGSIAVLMAYRDCYLRHGILPAQVVFDWGSEFVNRAIRETSGFFGVGYEQRPPGAPRFGAMGEMFNAQISSFLQSLSGGMYFDKLGRSADAKRKSIATASMSIEQIVDRADQWMFEVWNRSPIGANSKTPEQLWQESLACFPEAVVQVKDCLLSRYFTSLPVKAKRVSASRGFRYGGSSFASEQLPSLLGRGERPVNPRLDCSDPSTLHVMTEAGPLSLRSLDYQRCQGLSEVQRLADMRRIYFARSIATANQEARNIKEARIRREIDAVSVTDRLVPDESLTEPRSTAELFLSQVSEEAIDALPRIHRHLRS